MVSELLTYARFDRENPNLQFNRQPVIPWLKDLLGHSLPSPGPSVCQWVYHVDNESCAAWFESKHMGRAVGNLVQNAIRCARHRIHVVFEQHDGQAVIHVDDDGPGIPENDRKRIFEPFTRLDSSRSRVSGGHGLGLAIVQRIAVWHRGSVDVLDSSLGGARFSIRWPGFAQHSGYDRQGRRIHISINGRLRNPYPT